MGRQSLHRAPLPGARQEVLSLNVMVLGDTGDYHRYAVKFGRFLLLFLFCTCMQGAGSVHVCESQKLILGLPQLLSTLYTEILSQNPEFPDSATVASQLAPGILLLPPKHCHIHLAFMEVLDIRNPVLKQQAVYPQGHLPNPKSSSDVNVIESRTLRVSIS